MLQCSAIDEITFAIGKPSKSLWGKMQLFNVGWVNPAVIGTAEPRTHASAGASDTEIS